MRTLRRNMDIDLWVTVKILMSQGTCIMSGGQLADVWRLGCQPLLDIAIRCEVNARVPCGVQHPFCSGSKIDKTGNNPARLTWDSYSMNYVSRK